MQTCAVSSGGGGAWSALSAMTIFKMKQRIFSAQISIYIDGCCSENDPASFLRDQNQHFANADCASAYACSETICVELLICIEYTASISSKQKFEK